MPDGFSFRYRYDLTLVERLPSVVTQRDAGNQCDELVLPLD